MASGTRTGHWIRMMVMMAEDCFPFIHRPEKEVLGTRRGKREKTFELIMGF